MSKAKPLQLPSAKHLNWSLGLAVALFGSPVTAQTIELRYDNFGSVDVPPIFGASSDVYHQGSRLGGARQTHAFGNVFSAMFFNGLRDIDTLNVDLTGVSNYDDLIRPGLTEVGPNILFIDSDQPITIDASRPPSADPLKEFRWLNHIEIVGNAATSSTPRSSFGFIGKEGLGDTVGVDHTIQNQSLTLTNAELTSQTDLSPWYNNGCTTTVGGACHDGDVTFILGGGAFHPDEVDVTLNNGSLNMGDRVLIDARRALNLRVGPGENTLRLGTTTNMLNQTGVFEVIGTNGNRAELSIIDTAVAITDNPENVRTSFRYLNLGQSAQLEFADLKLINSSVSSPIDAQWSFANSTIELREPNRTTALRIGNVSMTDTVINARSSDKFIYLGYQTTGRRGMVTLSNVFLDYSDAEDSVVYIDADVDVTDDLQIWSVNPGSATPNTTNDVEFRFETNLKSGRLSVDSAFFSVLSTDAGTQFQLLETADINITRGTFDGDFRGSGFINGGVGGPLTFNGVVAPDRVKLDANGTIIDSSHFGEMNFGGKPLTFGPNSVFEVDTRAALKVGSTVAFQTDYLSSRVADINALPNVQVNLIDNPSIPVTADDLDGSQVVVAEVLDLIALPQGASLNFDPATDTTVTLGGNVPALLTASALNEPGFNGPSGTWPGYETVGNVTVEFTKAPVSQLSKQPSAPQNTSANNQVAQAATHSTTGSSGQGPTLTNGQTLQTALNALTNTQLNQMGSVHAEPYSSYLTVGLEEMDIVRDMVLRQAAFGGWRSDSSSGDVAQLATNLTGEIGLEAATQAQRFEPATWVELGFVDGEIDGDANFGGYDYDLRAIAIGADLYREGDTQFGAFFAYGTSDMTQHDVVDQTFDGSGIHFGGYGSSALANGWEISGAIGGMIGEQSTTRTNPTIGNFTGGTAEGEFDTKGFFLGGNMRRNLIQGNGAVLSPVFGMAYGWTQMDGHQETGTGDFVYKVEKADAESFILSAGLDYLTPLASNGQGAWQFEGFVRYEYDVLADDDDVHEVTVSAPAFGSFTQVGLNRGPHRFNLGMGLHYDLNEKIKLAFGYGFGWDSNGTEQAFAANLRATW